MYTIKRLFTSVIVVRKGRRPDALRSDALKHSALAKLDVDVLLYLTTDFLSSEAAASLTLSCQHLYHLLGTRYLLRLSSHPTPTSC